MSYHKLWALFPNSTFWELFELKYFWKTKFKKRFFTFFCLSFSLCFFCFSFVSLFFSFVSFSFSFVAYYFSIFFPFFFLFLFSSFSLKEGGSTRDAFTQKVAATVLPNFGEAICSTPCAARIPVTSWVRLTVSRWTPFTSWRLRWSGMNCFTIENASGWDGGRLRDMIKDKLPLVPWHASEALPVCIKTSTHTTPSATLSTNRSSYESNWHAQAWCKDPYTTARHWMYTRSANHPISESCDTSSKNHPAWNKLLVLRTMTTHWRWTASSANDRASGPMFEERATLRQHREHFAHPREAKFPHHVSNACALQSGF